MGPASENAGYGSVRLIRRSGIVRLQWVQRPRTPVMVTITCKVTREGIWSRSSFNGSGIRERAPVMTPMSETDARIGVILTGFNGSSVRERRLWTGLGLTCFSFERLMTCFNGSSVRERRLCAGIAVLRVFARHGHRASMGPASENAGYVRTQEAASVYARRHHQDGFNGSSVRERPVMQPERSERSGPVQCGDGFTSFNGSSVRERRLCLLSTRLLSLYSAKASIGSSVRERRLY